MAAIASAIACNDNTDTGGTTNNDQNPSTPSCTSASDCDSSQFCNSHATCQLKMTPATPVETLSLTITGRGSVTASDAGNTYGQCAAESCGYDIPRGATGTLTAHPAAGWAFSAWSGDCVSTTASVELTMDANKSCGVTFVQAPADQVTVAGTAHTSDLGSVAIDACDGGSTCSVDVGTHVTMTATAGTNARFDSWTGDAACVVGETPNVVSFDAAQDTTCTANFIGENTVTVSAATGCSASVSIDSCVGATCQCNDANSSCMGDTGTTFTLTVVPSQNIDFLGWLDDAGGDVNVGNCPPTTNLSQSATGNLGCHANCAPHQFQVTASANPVGGGTVSVICVPSGGGDPVDCSTAIAGTTATFSAIADPSATFVSWSCNVGSTPVVNPANPVEFVVSSDISCTATFVSVS